MPPLSPPDPPLTDGVIALRGYRPEDADQVVAALQDPDIVRFTRVPPEYSHADFEAFLERCAESARTGDGLSLAVVDADDHGRLLGSAGLHELNAGRPDIGYWVARGARGRGVAPRAAGLLRDWATRTLGLERIEVLIHPENQPSQRVAVKAGFHRTGEYRPSPRRDPAEARPDLVVFAWPDDGGAGGGAG
jgi:RimJ/RimL family protein N-acetyltransferase